MNLDSVRAFKQKVSEETVIRALAAADDVPGTMSFYQATEPPMPAGMALGVAKRADGEHVLAIRSESQAEADAMAARVNGEADIQIIHVTHRNTPAYFQSRRRPLEYGQQIGMRNKNFVGTLGFFARDAAGKLGIVSNSHVIADQGRASPGHAIGQPGGWNSADLMAVLAKFVPYSFTAPNLVDCGFARLDKTSAQMDPYGPLGAKLKGARRPGPEDLHREVFHPGRTTGVKLGTISAVEMDGVPCGMDAGITYWNDQLEITGGPNDDFSAGGDSGSVITDRDGWVIGLLFAGGRDGNGVDRTYANHAVNVLSALSLTLAI